MSTGLSYCGIEPRQNSAAVWNGWSIEPNPTRPCGVPLTYRLDARFRERMNANRIREFQKKKYVHVNSSSIESTKAHHDMHTVPAAFVIIHLEKHRERIILG